MHQEFAFSFHSNRKVEPCEVDTSIDTGENSFSSRWKDDHVAENR